MRPSRRAAVLEHILDAASLEELFTGSQRDRADTHRVLADVARGGSGVTQRAIGAVARERGVTPQYIVDRVMVFVTRITEAHRCDPYQVLGVQRTASAQDIQRRWRQLAKRFHPDVGADPEGGAVFRRLHDAYEILRDPDRRVRFEARQLRDGELVAWSAAAAPPGGAARGVEWVQDHFVDFGRQLAALGIVPAAIRRLGVAAVVVIAGWMVAQAYWSSSAPGEPSPVSGSQPALPLHQPQMEGGPLWVQAEEPEITEQASTGAPAPNSDPENARSETSLEVGLAAVETGRIVEDHGPKEVATKPGDKEPASWSIKAYPGSGETPALPARARGPVTRDEATRFIETYRQHYENRRVSALVGLFADDAVENARIGRHAIGAAYRAALEPLGGVSYELGGLQFKQVGEGMRVESPFTIVYDGKGGTQTVTGVAAWNIVRRGDGLKIARLSYEIDR